MSVLRVFASFILAFLFLLLISSSVFASLVVVQKDGKVVLNVLSIEDTVELEIPRRDYLEVKSIAQEIPDPGSKISLARKDGKVTLRVSTKSGEKSLDVTNYKDEIVEIEERPALERVRIGVSGDFFTIEQRGVLAKTDYEINIDPESAGITLTTPSGLRFLSLLPYQAAETALRAKIINRLGDKDSVVIKEEGQELSYELAGERVINFFNVFEYSVPVKTKISASTGEVLSIEQPTWLKVLGFLFIS